MTKTFSCDPLRRQWRVTWKNSYGGGINTYSSKSDAVSVAESCYWDGGSATIHEVQSVDLDLTEYGHKEQQWLIVDTITNYQRPQYPVHPCG